MTIKDWIKVVLIGYMLSFLINVPIFFIGVMAAQVQSTIPTKIEKTTIFPKGTFESEVKHTQ